MKLEETQRNLEEIRQRQANRIGELITSLETEKAMASQKLLQQEEEMRAKFNEEIHEAKDMMENMRDEIQEVVDLFHFYWNEF